MRKHKISVMVALSKSPNDVSLKFPMPNKVIIIVVTVDQGLKERLKLFSILI